MQQARPQPRAPGSFSPLPGSSSSPNILSQRPRPPARVESSSSEDSLSLNFVKPRSHASSAATGTPIYAQFANSSQTSLQNFSRPSVGASQRTSNDVGRTASPLIKGHSRKHSQTQGLFEPTLPSTSTSNLSQVGMAQPATTTPSPALTASQIAAQAAVLQHQSSAHARQRSQTVPAPGALDNIDSTRRGSGNKGPLSPPMLSLTEASGPRESGFGNQGYHNGLLGSHSAAATAAANVAFPRSGQSSPSLPQQVAHQPPPVIIPERPLKPEKSKVKLFSRPGKIGTKGESKDKPLPSPSKIGNALASLQRGNFSTSSLVDSSSQSMYSLNNSSSATIRPADTPIEKEGKEKEKRHHFLSRQKNKLKEDFHLPLSSANSNSKPTDPNAPSSLYSFNLPPSPGPNSTSFSKVRRDKKTERSDSRLENESSFNIPGEWPGPSSLTSLSNQSSMYLLEPMESGKYGLNNMSLDDAWPYLKAKMLVIFEGEDLRQPVEDFNRLVTLHVQYCIQRRSPNIILEDMRELLATGFASLDGSLRRTQEDKVIPALVEMWLVTFTSILPFMQAVFLPLDLEFSGCGVLMTPEQARDFWGGVKASSPNDNVPHVSPAAAVLDVRRLVLTAYRDIVILPRYDSLKTIFSRLSLEFLPSTFASIALASPLPDPALSSSPSDSFSMVRPGTAMSLDPSVASYNSNSTTLFGDGSVGSRSRAISNVSYASGGSDGQLRPFTPSSVQVLGSLREQNVEDSKQVTEMVGRMLQCMSVLASVGVAGGGEDDANKKMQELCRLLKLNWLGRGRTGRNRRGIVGGRVRRDAPEQVREVREEVSVI